MPFEFVDIVVLLLIIQSTHAVRVIALRTYYICSTLTPSENNN
jgi:hypothetical protein